MGMWRESSSIYSSLEMSEKLSEIDWESESAQKSSFSLYTSDIGAYRRCVAQLSMLSASLIDEELRYFCFSSGRELNRPPRKFSLLLKMLSLLSIVMLDSLSDLFAISVGLKRLASRHLSITSLTT